MSTAKTTPRGNAVLAAVGRANVPAVHPTLRDAGAVFGVRKLACAFLPAGLPAGPSASDGRVAR